MFALFGFTWGAMPVDPSRLRGRYADAYVAVAGPLVNLSLAVLCTIADALWVSFGAGVTAQHVYANLHTFLWTGAMINVMGVMFNLIPVPPLDGARILADFVPAFDRLIRTEKGALIGLFAFAILFMSGGEKIWSFVFLITNRAIKTLVGVMGASWPF
jgi:Zn-dependent protease